MGVENATVEAFFERPTINGAKARRLGSTITDEGGHYAIDYETPCCDHDSWDLKLSVGATSPAASDDVVASCIRTDPAATEAVEIRAEQKRLIEAGILADPESVAEARAAERATALMRSEQIIAAQRKELASSLESTLEVCSRV